MDHRVLHASYVNKTLVGGESEFLYAAYSAFEVEAVDWYGIPKEEEGKYRKHESGSNKDRHHKYLEQTSHQILIRAANDNTKWEEDLDLAPWY